MSITRTLSKCACGASIETPSTSELTDWHKAHAVCLTPKAPELPKDYIPNHTEVRRKLWKDVVIAVAASSNAQQKSSMHGWADYALAEFDKRFPAY